MARNFVMGATVRLRTNQFTGGARRAQNATSMFSRSVSTADRSVRTWRDSNDRLRSGLGRVEDASEGATRATGRFNREAKGLGRTLGGVKGLVAAFVGSMAVKKAGEWLIGANANMETYQNTLTVVMGSQEKAIEQLEWAEKFASKTPFEIPGIVEATTKLEAYGLESRKVLGITGDMASVMGKDLMQAVEAVADAQTGEVERLKEFGITKDMIAEQAKLMGVTAVNAKGQITDMVAFNAALFTIMEKKFAGGMEMQSKTFKGMLSNVKDFVGRMGRRLGAPLFERAKEQLVIFLAFLNRLEEEGKIDAFIANVTTGVKTFVSNIKKMTDFVIKHKEIIIPVIAGIASAFLAFKGISKAIKIFNLLKNAATLLAPVLAAVSWPVIAVAAAIGLLVGAFIYAWRNSEKFRSIVIGAIEKVKAFVSPAVEAVRLAIVNAFSAVLAWVNTYWPKIQSIIEFVWAFLGPYIAVQLEFLKTLISNAFSIVVTIIQGAWDIITTVIQTAWTVISNMVGFWLNLFTGDFEVAFENVKAIFTGLWDGITGILGTFIGTLWESGKKIMETLGEGIKAGIKAPIEAVKGGFKKIREMLPFSDAKMGPLSDLTLSGKKIMETLTTGIKSAATAPFKAVKGAFSKIREMLPFSDAHEGPFSDLTLSGTRIMETVSVGVTDAEKKPFDAVRRAFNMVDLQIPGMDRIFEIPAKFVGLEVPEVLQEIPASFKGALSGLKIPAAGGGSVTNNTTTTTVPIEFKERSIVIEVKEVADLDTVAFKNKIVTILYDAAKSASDVISNGSLEVVL